MSNLSIRKKSLNTWLHNDSVFGDFIISKFYFNSFEAKFQIVEEGNTRLERYEIANITLYDDTDGGTPETFSTITELSLRLEELQYPAFDRSGGGTSATFQELFADNGYEIISNADETGAETTIDLVSNKFEVFRRSFNNTALMKFFIEANDDDVLGSAKLAKSSTDEVIAYRSDFSYSTTEKLTGGTWIDDKPIYKKVIEYTFDSSGFGVSIPHGISDLETVVDGKILTLGSSRRVDSITASNVWGDTFITDTNVEIENLSSITDTTINIILEYTKTT